METILYILKAVIMKTRGHDFKMAAANSKMADKICVNCYRFSVRIMHFLNRETIYILKTQNGSTMMGG